MPVCLQILVGFRPALVRVGIAGFDSFVHEVPRHLLAVLVRKLLLRLGQLAAILGSLDRREVGVRLFLRRVEKLVRQADIVSAAELPVDVRKLFLRLRRQIVLRFDGGGD